MNPFPRLQVFDKVTSYIALRKHIYIYICVFIYIDIYVYLHIHIIASYIALRDPGLGKERKSQNKPDRDDRVFSVVIIDFFFTFLRDIFL